jgi:hypothetical protein
MGNELLTERYASEIAGVLNCWDRVLVFQTLPKICFVAGMTSNLSERQVRNFDYPRFAEPFRDQLRENAERLAAEFLPRKLFHIGDRPPDSSICRCLLWNSSNWLA